MSTNLVLAAAAGVSVASTATLWIRTHRLTSTLARTRTWLQAARYDAEHDGLTGLPNRAAFYARAARLLADAPGPLAVLLLDLDGFKQVNDSYGHGNGDLVLHLVARRLAARVGPADLVARLGGDEFAVLAHLPAPGAAEQLGAVLRAAADGPLEVDDVHVHGIRFSVGIAPVPAAPQLELPLGVLLRRADAAMYRAKQGSGVAVYDEHRDDHSTPELDVRPLLRTRDLGDSALAHPPRLGVAA